MKQTNLQERETSERKEQRQENNDIGKTGEMSEKCRGEQILGKNIICISLKEAKVTSSSKYAYMISDNKYT